MDNVIWLDSKDNVATVLNDIEQGAELQIGDIKVSAKEQIPFGHKLALSDIPAGEKVYKYGEPIGMATQDIPSGAWVHVHNCASIRGVAN